MSTLLSAASIFSYIGYILLAVVILLLMVLIHELGHYTAGKILKFKINEFSVGFGPKILQKTKKNGEKVSLRLFPLGGYCAFEGEGETQVDDKKNLNKSDIKFEGDKPEQKEATYNPHAFNNQKPWKRLIVLFFGAFFNFLSGIIFSFILLLSNGYDLVQVKNITPDSINYGIIQTSDVIVGIEGDNINFVKDKYLNTLLTEHTELKYPNFVASEEQKLTDLYSYTENGKTYYMQQQSLTFNVRRDGKTIALDNAQIMVIFNDKGEFSGWSLMPTEENTNDFEIATYKYSFVETLREFIPFTFKWAWKVLVIFGRLITGQLSIKAIGGPVTTINMIASTTRANFSNVLILLPAIAVNLAVFNLLPIPALDGFQMLFVIIEWIRKKPVKQSVINMINNIGLLVLFAFVIIVDIIQFLPF